MTKPMSSRWSGIFYGLLFVLPTPVFSAQLLDVCAAQSLVTIKVGKAGALARLAHQHIVAIHKLAGQVTIAAELNTSSARLSVQLKDLVVDETELRRQAGFDSQPSAKDIKGTSKNMHKRVLETGHYRELELEVSSLRPLKNEPGNYLLDSTIKLHGQAVKLEIPATITLSPQQIEVLGHFEVLQSDFGIKPFKAFLGMLKVTDKLLINYKVIAAEFCPQSSIF